MWILTAFGSAIFAGLASILAKFGIKKVDSHLATALRTIVVLIFAWIMVFISGSYSTIPSISLRSYCFLALSGIATGASWLCYFRALQLGNINKVVPVDKTSTVLTIVLAFIILNEPLTSVSGTIGNIIAVIKVLAILLILIGTFMMIQKKETDQTEEKGQKWLIYAVLSAVFAALTSILAKIGIEDVESNLGTAIRTIVVLIMAWLIVFITNKHTEIKDIDNKSRIFILLSGVATGLSWLCFYNAIKNGLVSVVQPIDKLSIIPTVLFSYFFFKEKLSKKALYGLIMIVIGTLLLLTDIFFK